MATIPHTDQMYFLDRRNFIWTGLGLGDDGDPSHYEGGPPGTVQVTGTFGAGGNIVIEGSNDKVNWVTLRETGGTGGPGSSVLSLNAPDLAGILEDPLYIRPRVTAGDGTTSINVILTVRKNQHSG